MYLCLYFFAFLPVNTDDDFRLLSEESDPLFTFPRTYSLWTAPFSVSWVLASLLDHSPSSLQKSFSSNSSHLKKTSTDLLLPSSYYPHFFAPFYTMLVIISIPLLSILSWTYFSQTWWKLFCQGYSHWTWCQVQWPLICLHAYPSFSTIWQGWHLKIHPLLAAASPPSGFLPALWPLFLSLLLLTLSLVF